MKRFSLITAVLLIFSLSVCNNKKIPSLPDQQKFETLPFKPATDSKKQMGDTTIPPSGMSYEDQIRVAFAKDSTISSAFKRFQKELPAARDKGKPAILFNEFINCSAFNSARNISSSQRPVLIEWVKMARAERDENIRMLFAQYSSYFNVDESHFYNFYMETSQIRPGEELRLHGYYYNYYDEIRNSSKRSNIEIALLSLNKQLKPDGFTPVHTDFITLNSYEDVYKYKVITPGVYRITVWTDVQFTQFYLQVSWLDCVIKADSKGILTFGSSFKDTLPPPYTVHFVNTTGEIYTSKTDNLGALYLKHQFGDAGSAASLKVILEKEGQLAFLENSIPGHTNDTTMEHYIYTDRPVYRPGHRVHFRGILKYIVNSATISPASVDSIVLLVTDPQGTKVWNDTIAVDPWGHFGDSIDIASDYKQGRYYIQFQNVRNIDPKRRIYNRRNYRNCSFLVDSYKKPEFVITVKPEKETWFTEEEPVFKVKGEYYFGGALANVPVTVRWYSQTMGHYFATWGKNRCMFYPDNARQFVRQEERTLDKSGELTLKWKSDTESGTPYGYIIAEVIAKDQSRREVREDAKVQIVKYDAYLAIIPDKYQYEVKETAKIEIVAVDMKGDALTGKVSLRVKKDGGIIADESMEIPTSGRIHYEMIVKEAGTYNIEASAKDRRGKTAFVEYSIAAVKKRTWDWNWERIEITSDKKQYSVGDTAHITVKSGADKTRALCTVEGQRLNEWKVDSLKNYTLEYLLPITASLGSNVQFHIAFSASAQMAYSSCPFTIVDSSSLLKISLEGTKTLKPGEQFTGTIIVTDRSGKPSKACMSVALVDEAIFDVAKSLKQANVYGYDYYRSWYHNQEQSQGVLSIMPPWYGNFVNTAYNRFDQNFLLALTGVSQQLESMREMASPKVQPVVASAPPPPPTARSSAILGELKSKKATLAARDGYGGFAEDIDKVMAKEESAENKNTGVEPPRERKEFKDLGYWNPALAIDAAGKAKLSFIMPGDLTKWRLVLLGSDGATHLVDYKDSLITKQDIMAKLEAPRGFVVDDSAQVATVIHNYSDKAVEAKVSLEIKAGASNIELRCENKRAINVQPNGTERIDWPLIVRNGGSVTFATTVVTPSGSDAESRTYPIRVHGIPKVISEAGMLTEKDPQIKIALPSPEQAAPGSRTLTIEYAPTLAYSMFESLDYLTGYPYGCVEQTMSRFLPNLYVAGVLKRLGIQNDSLIKMIPEYTHKGLERLHKFQHSDGGWGWWESDKTDPRMTALVLYGLSYAIKADIKNEDKALASSMMERGIKSAISQMQQQNNNDAILLAHALCAAGHCSEVEKEIIKINNKRGNLSSYELALLLESLSALNKKVEISKVVELLETQSTENSGTVFWASSSDYFWYRQDEETTARVVRALMSVNPNHPMIPKAVSWLSRAKHNGYWVCTKTTAVVIDALSYYIEKSGEFDPDYTATINLNGRALASVKVTKTSLKNWSGKLVLSDSLIGKQNDLQFKIDGKGRLYYTVNLRYATNERPIKSASNGIVVSRKYTRLVYQQNRDGDWKVSREPFEGKLLGGDELEVAVTVKNNQSGEYMMLEDCFPSGMEILHKEQDWYSQWCGYWWYGFDHKEARDDRMVWFVSTINKGERTFSYLLRAETPGVFVALPARAELMYEPEVCGNSAETVVKIEDAKIRRASH